MKRTWLAAVALSLAPMAFAGCSVRTTHTLVSAAYEVVPSGTCVTEGPYAIPGGASMTYDITDFGDDMDVGFTSVADGCDLTYALAPESNTYWGGTLVETADNVPPDSYYFVMNCYNLDGADCIPTLNSWTYEH